LICLKDEAHFAASIATMAAGLAERVVAGMAMFKHVARAHLAELAVHTEMTHLKRGDFACRRGQSLSCFYGIAYGQVKLVLRSGSGEEKVLRIAGPGETFCEALVFRTRPNPVDAVALCETLLLTFPARAVHALLDSDSNFARAMLACLSARMQDLVDGIGANALLSARQRIASYLIALAEASGSSRVRLPVTKTLIASQLGVTKETLSRLLREFADKGLIAIDKRDILLRDRALLAAAAGTTSAPLLSDIPVSESSSV
jgi:CRP/FNR family transcriptional regulator, dissimilatory nitrate respiration regulator